MNRRTSVIALGAAAIAAGALVSGPAASADPAPALTPIGSGWIAPLHLSFGPGKSLYVADAFGANVQRVRLWNGQQSTVYQGTQPVMGVDVRGNGAIYATLSIGDPSQPLPTSLIQVYQSGKSRQVADLLAFETANNPDGQNPATPDSTSNPYSVLALKDRVIVADAGANDLLVVKHGKVKALTVFPTFTVPGCPPNNNGDVSCDPVPTDVELGPDGYLYVSGLGAEVEGHIYKVNRWNGTIVRTWGGLPPLTGIAVGKHGEIYASSLFASKVFKITGHGMWAADVPGATDVEYGNGMLVVGSMAFPPGSGPGAVYKLSPKAFVAMN
jgi:hypothetical protein